MALLLRTLDARLAAQTADLARLEWTDGETVSAAVESYGWIPDGSMMNSYLTPGGHTVYPEDFGMPGPPQEEEWCQIPFAYYYEPDERDIAGERAGQRTNLSMIRSLRRRDSRWAWQQDAGRVGFDTAWRIVADLLAEELGRAEVTARVPYSPDDPDAVPWNYAAWRCKDKAVIVGQCAELISYSVFEQALVWIGRFPETRDFPAAEDFWDLIEG